MGSAVSVSDMGRLPEIIEREKFYELTGYNEYALMATTATAKTSLTQTALSGKQIVYASKLNNKYVYFLTSIPSFSFDFLLNSRDKPFNTRQMAKFGVEAYDCFADSDGKMSKERFLDVVSSCDCFLSHDWGIDESGRHTHERVQRVADYLRSKGLFVYLDEGQLHNKLQVECLKTEERLQFALRKSQCAILFLTKRYSDKICQSRYQNDIKTEYEIICKLKGLRYMIPVVFEDFFQPLLRYEEHTNSPASTENSPEIAADKRGYHSVSEADIERIARAGDTLIVPAATCRADNLLFRQFKEKPCVDLTSFERSHDQCEQLYDYILNTILPLRMGGHYKHSNYIYANTVSGRHFAWFRHHIPASIIDHLAAKRCAEALTQHGIETTVRLWSTLQADPTFLCTALDLTPEVAEEVKRKVREDIRSYFMQQKHLLTIHYWPSRKRIKISILCYEFVSILEV